MSEDPTKDLTTNEILRLILNRVTDVETRLGAFESLVEDRFKDTRPIWQAINARTERIEETLIDLKDQMSTLAYRELELHAAQSRLSSRVSNLETRASDGERGQN
ncbi:MAG: hypothetical protein ACREAB_10160 [Blastocatellia bacterium]